MGQIRQVGNKGSLMLIKILRSGHPIPEVMNMDKKQLEKLQQKKNQEKFNSVTQKVKPENQNQEHNVRSEAVEPKNWQV